MDTTIATLSTEMIILKRKQFWTAAAHLLKYYNVETIGELPVIKHTSVYNRAVDLGLLYPGTEIVNLSQVFYELEK